MWVNTERANHVDKGVRVDVLLVGMASEHKLEFRRCHKLASDVLYVVTDYALGSREIAYRHFNDPALCIGKIGTTPKFHVFLHGNVLWFPVVVLHRFVKIVCPLVFERQDVKKHGVLAVNDLFRIKSFLSFGLVKNEGFITNCVVFFHSLCA